MDRHSGHRALRASGRHLIFSPTGQLVVRDPYDALSLAIFLVFGIALSIVLELFRRDREKLAAYQVEDAIFNERRKAEEERQKAESARAERQRLLDVLETLPSMVSLLTTDHRVIFANRSFREKYGEPCGEPCFKVRHGRNEPCVPCETFFPLETGEPHHREVIFRDGSLIDAYDFPFTDLDGSSVILEVGVDITERRRAETELEQYRERLEALVQERTCQLQAVNAQLEADIKVREQVEKSFRESRAKLAAALASMADSVLITDAEGRFVDFNDTYAAFYRFKSRAECLQDFAEFSNLVEVCMANGEPAPQEMYAMRRALRGETAIGAEYKLRRRDSGESWMGSISFSPIRDKDGVITGSVITAHDVTERKRAEEELKKLNRTLKALSNSNQALMRAEDESAFLNDVCRIVIDDCGHAMVWIGIAEHDECKTVRAVAHAGFDNGYLETLRITWGDGERGQGPTGTAIRTGQPAMCRDSRADPAFAPWRDEAVKRGYTSSLVMPLKERGEAWGAITIYSRETDAFSKGEVDLLTELAGDVEFGVQTLRLRAAHARAEENLRESESRLGLFIEHAPAALAMFDTRMCYLRASRRWRADFGLGDRDLNGVSHYDAFPEIPEAWKEAHRRGLAGEVVRADADRFERADGSEQWIRWEIFPWRDAEGHVGGIVIFSEDITQRKQAEAALFESQKMALQREQLHALAVRQQRAREEERTKVSRDLHDQIGQILTAIKMDMTWMGRRLARTQGPVRERLAGTVELINDDRHDHVHHQPHPVAMEQGEIRFVSPAVGPGPRPAAIGTRG